MPDPDVKDQTGTEPEVVCSKCGSVKNLQPDLDMDDVWYCRDCIERFQVQQRAIREGYAVNPDASDWKRVSSFHEVTPCEKHG